MSMPYCATRFIALAATLLLALSACGPVTFTVGGKQTGLNETTVVAEPGHRGAKIAVIDITGVILNAEPRGLLSTGDNPVSILHEKLNRAADDRDVKAVILRLNTPGGGVTASDVMYREVQRFKQRTGKPVVALAMDVTASGGYYVACASDTIVAHPTSVVGSIGVIAQTISFRDALTRWGIEPTAITSGSNKAAGSPLEKLTDEHRAILQSLVDDFYDGFVEIVKTHRPNIPEDQFKTVTDGRVMSGEKALKLGLVDHLGDVYTAIDQAKALADIPQANVVAYHRPLDYTPTPYATTPTGGTQVNLAQFNLSRGGTHTPLGFYYLWQPDLK